ncbi:MAG: hypothetical protein HY735_13715 [Verrucomicrobia bacterium]|nr:hypothetical protein [Verrucomicrobiota bacterium]
MSTKPRPPWHFTLWSGRQVRALCGSQDGHRYDIASNSKTHRESGLRRLA